MYMVRCDEEDDNPVVRISDGSPVPAPNSLPAIRSGRRALWRGLRALLGLLLLGLLLWNADVHRTLDTMGRLDVTYLSPFIALLAAAVLLSAYQWHVLLAATGVSGVPLHKLIALYLVGSFFNNFLPTGMGGDIVRAYQLSQYCGETDVAVSSVLMTRLTGLFGLLGLASLTIPLYLELGHLGSILIIFLALAIIVTIPVSAFLLGRAPGEIVRQVGRLFGPSAGDSLGQIGDALHTYGAQWRVLLRASVVAAVFQVTVILMSCLAALSLGVHVPARYFILFVPLINLAAMAPISINGLGVREALYVFLFTQVGLTAAEALSISFIMLGTILATSVAGGVIYALGDSLLPS